ncbi:hypothetical protein [Methylobacterium nigriterrae]|uniref:hypothetical protein n=1 Tax=Methylobacterium nigriterrae TaxID=3127512 RepID=UPI00301331B4
MIYVVGMSGNPPPSVGLSLKKEQADLAKAEQDIVEGERRVAEQELLIAQLRSEGHDTALAEQLLATLKATLAEWYAHRETILCTIHRLQAREP